MLAFFATVLPIRTLHLSDTRLAINLLPAGQGEILFSFKIARRVAGLMKSSRSNSWISNPPTQQTLRTFPKYLNNAHLCFLLPLLVTVS